MERKLTQKDLKEALSGSFELYGAHVDKITFKTGIGTDDKPEFNGASIVFKEGSANRTAGQVYDYAPGELGVMLNRQFNEEGFTAADENNEGAVNVNFEMGTRTVSGTPIPVFKGVTAQLQEYDRSVDMNDEEPEEYYEDQKMESLADIRRQEQAESLGQLDDWDIMEMARAHFDSHPTLPGEKNLKMMVNDELANDGYLSDEQRERLIQGYAQTRIRETKMDSIGREFNPADLNLEFMSQNGTISMSRVNVELQKQTAGDETTVYVLADCADGRHMTIGKLPDKFLTNNPMNVESCKAELQVTDYSNGKLKNVSMRLVADTDLMSGDVVNLDDEMFADLDHNMKNNFEANIRNDSQKPDGQNKKWKPQQFENVWFPVADPTKASGVIPAYGHINQIIDGKLDISVISAESSHGRILYEGRTLIAADECAPKKSEIYNRMKQANADFKRLEPVAVEGYNLTAKRYQHLSESYRDSISENTDFKVREVYETESHKLPELAQDHIAAGGKLYLRDEPVDGKALISTTENGDDGMYFMVDEEDISQEVRLVSDEHEFDGKLYMVGGVKDDCAYVAKQPDGEIMGMIPISDVEYITVEEQNFGEFIAKISMENSTQMEQ